jgi:hypothetical protein
VQVVGCLFSFNEKVKKKKNPKEEECFSFKLGKIDAAIVTELRCVLQSKLFLSLLFFF